MRKRYLMVNDVQCLARGDSDVFNQLNAASFASESDRAFGELAFAEGIHEVTLSRMKLSLECVIKVLQVFLSN